MFVEHPDLAAAALAATIGEPARARMLYSLVDGRARTSTELASLAEVSPSTASVHLKRLLKHRLVKVFAQGKHRYYTLRGAEVAGLLESLNVLSGTPEKFTPSTPKGLRAARTCYDHVAGSLGVALHDRMKVMGWFRGDFSYDLTRAGSKGLTELGVDVESARRQRRRFAYPCVDWSERRPHLAGALGAALLELAIKRKWVEQELDERALAVTRRGRQELLAPLGLEQTALSLSPTR